MSETVGKTTLEEELLNTGYFSYVTEGESMEPLFRTHRDVVVIKKLDGELRPLDIALYRGGREGQYILHRVIRVKEKCYITRGDNTYENEYVPKDMVLGVLVEFIRSGKKQAVTAPKYRLYSRFWTAIYPLRRLWHATRRSLARLYRKVFPKKK